MTIVGAGIIVVSVGAVLLAVHEIQGRYPRDLPPAVARPVVGPPSQLLALLETVLVAPLLFVGAILAFSVGFLLALARSGDD